MSSKPTAVPPVQQESCDFCHAPLAEQHQHLIEPVARRLECVCDACAILFGSQGQTKYRRVTRRIQYLPDFRLSDLDWNALMIPIGMAFMFHSSAAGKVIALYPSPAGAVESTLPLDSWARIVAENPVLQTMEQDIEGLLVCRVGGNRDHLIIPIDECFKLVGLIRTRWKGFSGGTDLWKEVERFLNRLKG
jgi:hypothetical protein